MSSDDDHIDLRSKGVDSHVALALPGVALDSPVQGWVYLNDFDRGLDEYAGITDPTAEDDRWAGVCHFKLQHDNEALDLFVRAADRGVAGARLNQAHVLMFLDGNAESRRILSEIEPDTLSAYDQVLLFRVKSLEEETSGNIRSALRHAEEAWRRVQGIPEFSVLAPSVLAQLGVLYARYGRAQRALWHLDRGIQMTSGVEQARVRMKRAIVLTALGHLGEARRELMTFATPSETAPLAAEQRLLLGDVRWASGEVDTALADYAMAAQLAEASELTYEAFLANIGRMTLSAFLHRERDAAEFRDKAERGVSDKSDRLQLEFRTTVSEYFVQGTCASANVGVGRLRQISDELFEMGLLQELGAVKLHLSCLLLHTSPAAAAGVLDELQELAVTLQNTAFLAREWVLLPEFRRHAQRTHPALAGLPAAILQLHTLGAERIVLAGNDVRMPLRRSAELLAYFMEHKSATFEQVRADLFPDEKHRTAKSYFHQFRHQLKERIAGLEIAYDRETRHYRLRSEMDVMWDVADLRAGRRQEAAGPFLPSCTSDWALTLDHTLERYRPVR